MMSRTMITSFLSAALVFSALSTSACGSGHESNTGHHARSMTAKSAGQDDKTPHLDGDALEVCGDLKEDGVVASKESIHGGMVVHLAAADHDVQTTLQDLAEKSIDERQDLEDAFKQVKASQHNDGSGVYIRFEHDDSEVLSAVKDIVQHGVNQNAQAKKRVKIKDDDGSIIMQLPDGGRLVQSKTESAAKDTVDKWTDRTPTDLSYETTDQGARIEIKSEDDDRFDEIQENVFAPLLGCD